MSNQRITWAGRTLHGSDRFGQWVTLDSTGWDDTPEPKGQEEERPNADGALDLPIYYGARLITHTGHLHVKNHDLLHDAMHHFNGAMAGLHLVEGHGPTLGAQAKRKTGTRFTPVTDTFAQWQVQLRAVDPCKYGQPRTFFAASEAPGGAGFPVHHRGNYHGVPQIIVRGDMPSGYTITLNGWQYQVTIPLVNGRPHRIDYRTGVLRVDGIIRQNSIGLTNLTTIPPGAIVYLGLTPLLGGGGDAELTVYDTYI